MKNNGKPGASAVAEPPVKTANDAPGDLSSSGSRIPTERRIWGPDGFRPLALAGLTILLLGLCVWLALPFLPALAWGSAFAIIAWPLHVWLRRKTGHPRAAALVTTVAVLLMIVVPGLLITYEIIRETNSSAEQMRNEAAGATVRARLATIPSLQGAVAWIDSANIDLDAEIRRLIMSYVREPSSLLQGSLAALIQFALALFILYHFLKDGPLLREQVRRLLPMTRTDADRIFLSVSDSVRANIYATVVTGLINAITGGLLFWSLGLPSPALWGFVVFIMSVLPVFGTFVVWAPAAIYMLVTNNWVAAALIVSWGVVTALIVDTLLYVRLAGKRMRLHQVPAMLAFLGGLVLFGPSGMILGPAILSVTVALLDVWRRRPTPVENGQTLLTTSA